MQARRILEARDHIAEAAYAAMRRVETDAALCRLSRLSCYGQPQLELATRINLVLSAGQPTNSGVGRAE
jgi:hypothetical protein